MNKEGQIIKTTKWLVFEVIKLKSKTIVIDVLNKERQSLGTIEWYPQWRQYCYFPEVGIVMANSCLKDITDIITDLMNKRI